MSSSPTAAQVRPSTVGPARGRRTPGAGRSSAASAATAPARAAPSRGGTSKPVRPGLDQVERSAGRRGDHRHPAGHAPPARSGRRSRAVRCGRRCRGWRRAGPAATRAAGPGTPRPAAPRRSADRAGPSPTITTRTPGSRAVRGQQVHPLLDGQPADVADQDLAVRARAPAGSRSSRRAGLKRLRVDAPAPQPDTRARRGRAASAAVDVDGASVRAARGVDAAQPAPGRVLARAHAVRPGVPGHVGLVDGDRRADPSRRAADAAPRAEHERAGQVDDVGPVVRAARR